MVDELQLMSLRLAERQHAAAFNRARARRTLDAIERVEQLEGISDPAHTGLSWLAPEAYKAMAERVLARDHRAAVDPRVRRPRQSTTSPKEA